MQTTPLTEGMPAVTTYSLKCRERRKTALSVRRNMPDIFATEVFVTIGGSRYKAAVKKVSSEKLYLYPKNASSLQHGAVGTVDLILKEKKDVLSLPLALVYDMGGKKVVYMEGKNGIKETREVTLGESINNMVEVISGLQENEQVITN